MCCAPPPPCASWAARWSAARDGVWRARGRGIGGLREAPDVLDLGNAGTGTRLLMGLVAPSPISSPSSPATPPCARARWRACRSRCRRMGARIVARDGGRLPLAVIGTAEPMPITYKLPVASAQVKSAILLAGLNTPGITTVIEPEPTRDHTELMLKGFGATLEGRADRRKAARVSLTGQPEIFGRKIVVPGDPSSAAFPLVAALIVPGSDIRLPNVGLNPHRIGLIETLLEMGADIAIENRARGSGRAGRRSARAPRRAQGRHGAGRARALDDRRISDPLGRRRLRRGRDQDARPRRTAREGKRSPVRDGAGPRRLRREGRGRQGQPHRHAAARRRPAACALPVKLDHRIGMSFLVLGMAAKKPVEIDDAEAIGTSLPRLRRPDERARRHGHQDQSMSAKKPWFVIAVDGPSAAGQGHAGPAAGRPFRLRLPRHRLALSRGRRSLSCAKALIRRTKKPRRRPPRR